MHARSRSTGLAALILASLGSTGCVWVQNYTDPLGPRYASPTAPGALPSAGDAHGVGRFGGPEVGPVDLHVATFNIEYGQEVGRALEVIRAEPGLREADLILLQEMSAEGTRDVAQELGMSWVYYPASRRGGQGFGNAVLSRWPIVDDAKVLLPHRALFGGNRRTATAVTVLVGEIPVRVYSVHLGTIVNQGVDERRDQMRTVLADAADYEHVVVGGDLNDPWIGKLALEEGYHWPTREGPRTLWFGRVDHILYRGLVPTWFESSGTVMDTRGASDHRPVWARGRLRRLVPPRQAAGPS